MCNAIMLLEEAIGESFSIKLSKFKKKDELGGSKPASMYRKLNKSKSSKCL
jgi:hypothetical protein